MRTSAAFTVFALAGMLAGCNHNSSSRTADRDRDGRTDTLVQDRDRDGRADTVVVRDEGYRSDYRTTYRSGDSRDGVVDFRGYDDRGGAINSGPVVVHGDWDASDPYSHRGYDDREVFHTGGRVTSSDRDNRGIGSKTYDDRSSVNSGTTATDRDNRDSNTWNDNSRDARTVAWTATPDARILSILHCKNQEEIKLGRLAQQNAQSSDVREYGEMLVRDHSASDARVMETARAAGITLLSEEETKRMCAREKGLSTPPKDVIAELQSKRGADFDSAFSQKMHMGHSELVRMVEDAQPKVQNTQVRALLSETLPKLREHENHAQRLAGVHDHDDR